MYHTVDITIAGAGARADFERARRGYLAARVGRLVKARSLSLSRPRDLGDVAALVWHSTRLRSIPLDAIVGTVDATSDFDAGFRAAADRVANRWQRVARAHRDGRPLSPIAVIERPDGHYVLDGRHRVSVARTLGHAHIDAWTSPSTSLARARAPENPRPKETLVSNLIHEVLATLTHALHPNESASTSTPATTAVPTSARTHTATHPPSTPRGADTGHLDHGLPRLVKPRRRSALIAS